MSFSTSFSVEWADLYASTSSESPTVNINGNIQVTLYPQWYKQITVEWSVPVEFGECRFNVYFSQSESGPFQKINIDLIDGTFLSDLSTREYSKFDKGWYYVEAILLEKNNAVLSSPPITWDTAQTNWVKRRSDEIQRREYILLDKFTGISSYLFRRLAYGKRCPECWDAVNEQIRKDHCSTCIGTGFEGGYFPPAPMKVQYEITPNSRDKVYFGKMESNQLGAWTIGVPVINSDDIIVRTGDWSLYKVEKIMPTELQANTVRQLIVLTQLGKKDPEYMLVKRNLPEFPTNYLI